MSETIDITQPRITVLLASEAGEPNIDHIDRQIKELGASTQLHVINEILRVYGYYIDTFILNIGWYLLTTNAPVRGLTILDAKTDAQRGVLLFDNISM